MNYIAESFVKLVLAVGRFDEDYVDAYHGPGEWQEEVKVEVEEKIKMNGRESVLKHIVDRATGLHADILKITPSNDNLEMLRHKYLEKQIKSLIARVEALAGKIFSFDEESEAYYDAVAPTYPESHFQKIRADLDSLLPGKGSIPQRYDEFKNRFTIPREKLDVVFSAAITECRKRTKTHIALPVGESFALEYVTNKAWSGYNWFKGNAHSLIQVNVDLPISIDRAVDLAAHEGYPGHHVYNSLLEHHLYKEKGWVEFSIFPLFSPQALIAEGTANFGIEVAFTPAERTAFEKEVLFPLAGLEPSKAVLYYKVHELVQRLSYAGNEAARSYLDGQATAEETVGWLVEYALMSQARAEQRIKFFEKYRSYVINYNLGQDLVRNFLERRGATPADPEKLWKEFSALLSTPRLPSGLL